MYASSAWHLTCKLKPKLNLGLESQNVEEKFTATLTLHFYIETCMHFKKPLVNLALIFLSPILFAATTATEQQNGWVLSARTTSADFSPSAARGKTFYDKVFSRNADMPSCAACHTADPRAIGKHAITGKSIAAMAPSANKERFTDATKTEKWFKRNCNDVTGRECTAAENADFVEFLIRGVK